MRYFSKARYRMLGLGAGAVLGLGAPSGAFLLRLWILKDFSFSSIQSEFSDHASFYFYSLITAPAFLGALGFVMGLFCDHLASRAKMLERLSKSMRDLAGRDDLTGLHNHRYLLEELSKEIERAQRSGRALCGMMIDIDHFKQINDRFGHLAGDRVLKDCADVLKAQLRKMDTLTRYGGDEFLAILPETSAQSAMGVAQRLRASVSGHLFKAFNQPLHVSVSVGLLNFEKNNPLTPKDFIEEADRALFEAKHSGRNRVCAYHKELEREAVLFKPTKPEGDETD